ncbi:MAG: response regulator transcription factor, partial [Kiritimatiellae bacterium]|nr:response regulator transcription factor [Kiritimatiellia bacterium]
MKRIKVLLADDHSVMRMGLATLIGSDPGMTVVGEAENGEAAVKLVNETHPDVIIMDLMMPVLSGAEATKRILETRPDTKILILTSYGTSSELAEAIRNGAHGALTKDAAAESILDAVHTVAAGGRII